MSHLQKSDNIIKTSELQILLGTWVSIIAANNYSWPTQSYWNIYKTILKCKIIIAQLLSTISEIIFLPSFYVDSNMSFSSALPKFEYSIARKTDHRYFSLEWTELEKNATYGMNILVMMLLRPIFCSLSRSALWCNWHKHRMVAMVVQAGIYRPSGAPEHSRWIGRVVGWSIKH